MGRRGRRIALYALAGALAGAIALPLLLNVISALPHIGTLTAIVFGLVVGGPLGSLIAAARDDGETAARVEHETGAAQGRAAVTTEGEDRKAARRRSSRGGRP